MTWKRWHNDSDVEIRYYDDVGGPSVNVRGADTETVLLFTRASWDAFLAAVRAPVEERYAAAERVGVQIILERDDARDRILVVESDNTRLGELLAECEAQRDDAMRVVDAARAAYVRVGHSITWRLGGLADAVDEFDQKVPSALLRTRQSDEQAESVGGEG